jgi:motility quorum-sensing regulator / GCU-specific mRNA interferase toxin
MEKGTPHCKLVRIKALVGAGRVKASASAFVGALELGIPGLEGMCAVIQSLTAADFYKSMTTHADHRIWQDVYHAKTSLGLAVYLKLTVVEEVLVVSFKEL